MPVLEAQPELESVFLPAPHPAPHPEPHPDPEPHPEPQPEPRPEPDPNPTALPTANLVELLVGGLPIVLKYLNIIDVPTALLG